MDALRHLQELLTIERRLEIPSYLVPYFIRTLPKALPWIQRCLKHHGPVISCVKRRCFDNDKSDSASPRAGSTADV